MLGTGQQDDVVVTAHRYTTQLFQAMSNYQFSRYGQQYGDMSFTAGAEWASRLSSPATGGYDFGAFGRGANGSYGASPLIQSLKTARPYGLYSGGPPQQYMLGDGSVFTGTPSALASFEQRRAAQANMVYMDRITGSTFGGIALGVSNSMGASPATQNLVHGLFSSADGLVMAYGGVRGAALPGNNSQTSLSVEANLRLRYRPEWTAEQQAAADLKVGVLNFSDTMVSQAVRGGTSARSMFASKNGPIAWSNDIDHLIDLQLGGSNTLPNLWPLDASVNRSLGAQIQSQIQGLPLGTRINRVTIGH